jgi:AbrB family looped-hinge helix DNA binding protein
MLTAALSSRGRVTIPRDVRRALNLKTRDQVIFVVEGKRALLIPARRRSIMELQGVLPATHAFPGHQQIRQAVGRQRGEAMSQGTSE